MTFEEFCKQELEERDYMKDSYEKHPEWLEYNYQEYLLRQKYPILDKLTEHRVVRVDIYENSETNKVCAGMQELCDDYFGVGLDSEELKQLGNVFFELSKIIDNYNKGE